ncbi:MAG: hypothetical protein R3E79_04735 [Caldilineaceae bacterium]
MRAPIATGLLLTHPPGVHWTRRGEEGWARRALAFTVTTNRP